MELACIVLHYQVVVTFKVKQVRNNFAIYIIDNRRVRVFVYLGFILGG
jgi:hypothetical protein